MSTVFRTRTPARQDDLTRLLLGNRPRGTRQREWELEFEDEGEQLLSPAQLADAVRANRVLARQIGWGCIRGGTVTIANAALNTRLGLAAGASEEDIANAVERWQIANMGGRGDGKLGAGTWSRLGVFTPGRFRQLRIPVNFGGRQLGVIEKTMPYLEQRSATHFGVAVEFGFRVTNMDAVTRAGFVDGGEDQFQWIQVVELRRVGVPAAEPAIQTLRRRSRGRIVDPTPSMIGTLDAHPYYWDEPGEVTGFQNRPASNGLCYDIIFSDAPNIPHAAALPGRRAYFNFETALVGIRRAGGTTRNVILNTVLWGFDIILVSGRPTLGLNAMRPGPIGGSAGFRRVLSDEANATPPTFPGHCFVGGGYARAATCT